MDVVFSAVWKWLTSTSAVTAFTVFSFFISLATFITMLCFKRRIHVIFEKNDFRVELKRRIKDLSGMCSALDQIYSKDFLLKIDLYLDELLAEYSFFPFKLKCRIHVAEFYIHHICIPDAEQNNTRRVYSLQKQLRHILTFIRKEGKIV